MASKVTPATEEEGLKVEGAKKEGGIVEAIRSFVFTHGRFSRSWALLHQTKLALMAPMVVK